MGFKLIAKSPNAVAGIEDASRKLFAVQFHPEVRHTKLGTEILRNFVLNICHAQPTWTPQHFVDATVATVREQVGSGRAICALSGGVDSAVAATFVDRALRDGDKSRLTSVFVNNGVLRKNEFEKVQQNLRDKLGLHVIAVDATERFLSKLARVTDPETKRKIIGNEFIVIFDEEAHRIEQVEGKVDGWSGDAVSRVINSRCQSGPSQVIRVASHNVSGLPEEMKLKLIEPLKELLKMKCGPSDAIPGMPEEVLQRQPFPGPGLAVRILGEVTPIGWRYCASAMTLSSARSNTPRPLHKSGSRLRCCCR
jgi:GMP synthase (glutamine-hydrolysing)